MTDGEALGFRRTNLLFNPGKIVLLFGSYKCIIGLSIIVLSMDVSVGNGISEAAFVYFPNAGN